ncbi:MAG: prolipoprotein diacylglyceryl transferase [Flavobacteriia bacterium]|nr:prolipoprotein diacylglyceryl transferase [Flavobacteriia bacterium]
MILGIDWKVSSELIEGWSTPNKYGLLFVSGIVLGYYVIKKMFKKENVSDQILDKLLLYIVIATVVGARLGHVFFYGPYWDNPITGERGYFSHPIDILKIYEGGLASHGAAIAIFIALVLFSRKIVQRPILYILDRVAAPISIAGCFIRLGNLVNHEIIGTPTNLPWGFKFYNAGPEYDINGEMVYRHPAQLYEALAYLALFLFLRFLYWKKDAGQKSGFLFGIFLTVMFIARFFIEFIKVGQTQRDDFWFINTGQILSIPFVLAGIYLIYRAIKKDKISI